MSRSPILRFVQPGILCILLLALLAGCSNPLTDAAEPTEEVDGSAAPTSPPAMPIITPTPFDPGAVTAASPTPEFEERPDVYVVEENDTLYGIAARFDVEISLLVAENGLSDPNDIWVGQELIIPPLE